MEGVSRREGKRGRETEKVRVQGEERGGDGEGRKEGERQGEEEEEGREGGRRKGERVREGAGAGREGREPEDRAEVRRKVRRMSLGNGRRGRGWRERDPEGGTTGGERATGRRGERKERRGVFRERSPQGVREAG